MKKIFFEGQEFNGMVITDGIYCVQIPDFPFDGTLEMAINFDVSTIEGLDEIEAIANELSAEIFYISDLIETPEFAAYEIK